MKYYDAEDRVRVRRSGRTLAYFQRRRLLRFRGMLRQAVQTAVDEEIAAIWEESCGPNWRELLRRGPGS